jgi:hypothetical protein
VIGRSRTARIRPGAGARQREGRPRGAASGSIREVKDGCWIGPAPAAVCALGHIQARLRPCGRTRSRVAQRQGAVDVRLTGRGRSAGKPRPRSSRDAAGPRAVRGKFPAPWRSTIGARPVPGRDRRRLAGNGWIPLAKSLGRTEVRRPAADGLVPESAGCRSPAASRRLRQRYPSRFRYSITGSAAGDT